MIIKIDSPDRKRVKFACKGCGKDFVKEIPAEVFQGVQQSNLALMLMQSEKEVACMVIVGGVSVSCPHCKTKIDIMKPGGSLKAKQSGGEEKPNTAVVVDAQHMFLGPDLRYGEWAVN